MNDQPYLRKVGWFVFLHLLPFAAFFLPGHVGLDCVIGAIVLYWTRIWFITAGYHCYFSHRSFKTGKLFRTLLAIGAQSSAQGSVQRWATAHRYHHAHSDDPDDLHSPVQRGFFYSHIGWLFSRRYLGPSMPKALNNEFPELRWLDRHPYISPLALAGVCILIFGWAGAAIAWGTSTIGTYHATFTVNSLSHLFGSRPYDTKDDSRNNWLVAIIMMGGGWHNNHHRFPSSVRQGIEWWEWDPTYYILVVMSWLGIVWDLRLPAKERSERADVTA